jgi:hypothetical protein
MNILALDLGTATGWAHNFGDDFRCGTYRLISDKERKAAKAERMDRRNDARVKRLFDFVTTWKGLVDAVVFEDVEFGQYRLQMQLWSSLRAAVWLAFPNTNIECVPVQTLKKFACHGNANKTAMARALVASYPKEYRFETRGKKQLVASLNPAQIGLASLSPVIDDNAIDAIWLHKWAQKNLSRI